MKIRKTVVKSFNNGEMICLLMKNDASTSTPTQSELDEISTRANNHDALLEALSDVIRVSECMAIMNQVDIDAISDYKKSKSTLDRVKGDS